MKELLATKNIHVFNEVYGIRASNGEKLDFKDHPFLWEVYGDFTPRQAILKAAQIGFSETANNKALWLAKHRKMDIIYSLPAANDVREFVAGKTNRIIANNPIYQEWTADKDSIEQKRVGESVIYFRGTWTERVALMISADLYIADEVDRSKQDVVAQFDTRLQHSKFGWRWYFSNPSAPGVGVDKPWSDSDQKHWFLKCEGCNTQQYLTMENIIGESYNGSTTGFGPANGGSIPSSPVYFGCTKCRKELNRRKGVWAKRWQDKEISGYWISLLMAPWVPAADILKKKKEFTEEQFANFVLGVPYVGKGNVLTQSLLFQNLIDRINPQDSRPIIGVDTGVDIRYVIGNKYGLFYFGECKDYSELEKLLQRWPNAIMVIDQGGDIIGPRKLREKYLNRVFLCFFRQDRNNDDLITWDDDKGVVTADRNKTIQLVVDEFTERRIPIYGTQADWYDYWLHWSHMYRVTVEDTLGVDRFKWMRSDRDDFALATIYWRIGMDRFLDSSVSFHESKALFGAPGLDVMANNTAFMPRNK